MGGDHKYNREAGRRRREAELQRGRGNLARCFNEMAQRTALTIILILLAVATASAQTPRPQPSPPTDVTGATYVEFDASTGIWVLRGNPVVVTRGTASVRAPSITYDSRQQIVRATGGVAYADTSAALDAARATVWLAEERVLAEGEVSGVLREGGGETRLASDTLEAWRRERRAVATGNVQIRRGAFALAGNHVEYLEIQQKVIAGGRSTVTAPEGRVTADRIEAFLDREEAEASGNVEIALRATSPSDPPIEGQASKAVLRRRDGIAILSGGATIRQGQNTATAMEITIDLRANRVVATGQAHLVLYPGR